MEYQRMRDLIQSLKAYDGDAGRNLEYEQAKKKLSTTIKALTTLGDAALDCLHPLLQEEPSWSRFFALEILQVIKSKQSIPHLITFLRISEGNDCWDECETALHTLVGIGKPTVEPLLAEIKADLESHKCNDYLVGACTEIRDERVYKMMKEVVEDYVENYRKYDPWLSIDSWVFHFPEQGNGGIIPLLERLAKMDHLSKQEKREIEGTIEQLRDPEKFKRECEEMIKSLDMAKVEQSMKILIGKKKINAKAFLERAQEPDKEYELNFKCGDCQERQNIKTGLIWVTDRNKYFYENEIMCKHCFSHTMQLTDQGKQQLTEKNVKILIGEGKGILPVGDMTMVENKKMPLKAAYNYLKKRIREESQNGELHLRFANTARKYNKYDEAIEHYKTAKILNPKLIAPSVNLADIYFHRFKYYRRKQAQEEAAKHFFDLVDLFNTNAYDDATISNRGHIEHFITTNAPDVGVNVTIQKVKIGRNEPCPCGSGKKFKKCCLLKQPC